MIVRQFPFLWRLSAFVLLATLAASQLAPARGATRSGRALYVAENGSDSANDGLSLATPFRTIQRCAQVAVAGDTCYIRAGTYRETVRPANSGAASAPITFTAYNNEAVVVSGLDLVTGWSLEQGAIYRAAMPWTVNNNGGELNEINPSVNDQVFVDGEMMVEARWPNISPSRQPALARADNARASGVSNVSSNSATYLDNDLAGAGSFWAGGKINFGPGYSIMYATCDVTGVTSGALSFQCDDTYGSWSNAMLRPSAQNNYFLWGKREALDAPGEWFRQGPAGAGTLSLWLPSGANPNQHRIEAKRRIYAFDLSRRSHIVIDGVGIVGASIQMHDGSQEPGNISEHISIRNITARYIWHAQHMRGFFTLVGNTGIRIRGNNNQIRDSMFDTSATSMIMLRGNGNVIANNVFANMGYNGASTGVSGRLLDAAGAHNLLTQNTLFNAGRYPIQADQGLDITYNDAYNSHLQISDLGVIYGWGTDGSGARIAYNLIHDAWGERNDALSYFGGYGIYLDDDTYNYHIYRNVVWNTTSPGIFAFGTNGTNMPNRPPADAPSNRFIHHNTVDGTLAISAKPDNNGLPQTLAGTFLSNNASRSLNSASGATISNNYVGDALHIDSTARRYELRAYSPAIGAGAALGSPYADAPMAPVGVPDAGAYEFGRPAFVAGAVVRPADLAGLNVQCAANANNASARCTVENLPLGRRLPADFQIRVGGGPAMSACQTTMDYASHMGTGVCDPVDVSGQTGVAPIAIRIGGAAWIDTGATVDLGPLAVFAVNPSRGSPADSTLVTITGRKFHQSSAAYRQTLSVSNPSAATLYGYQVAITLDTAALVGAGKLRQDCADLRFADQYGSLPYWIERGCNTPQTRIWIKAAALPPGTSAIVMSYGNPMLSAGSDGAATFAFFDDFSDGVIGNVWNAPANGAVNITETNGAMRIAGTTDSANQYTPLGFTLQLWKLALPASFAIDTEWSIVDQPSGRPYKADVGAGSSTIGLYSASATDRAVGYWDGTRYVNLGDSAIDGTTFGPQSVSTMWTPDGSNQIVRYFENGALKASRTVAPTAAKGYFNYSPNAPNIAFDVRFATVRVRHAVFPEPTVTLGGEAAADAITVEFAGLPCRQVTVASPTQLTCLTPAHPAGAVAVAATNPNGATDTLPAGYTYSLLSWRAYIPMLRR